jgi:hypothetical protein
LVPVGTYAATIEHYASLQPDYIGIIDDLGDPGPNRPFDASGIFSVTGYRPMLPLVLYEKGTLTRNRRTGAALEYVGSTLAALDRRLARAAGEPGARPDVPYADAMIAAIDDTHRHARGVVVALALDRHGGPAPEFRRPRGEAGGHRRSVRLQADVFFVAADRGLGQQGIFMIRSLRLDGFSFGATATSIAAQAIAPAFLDLIPSDNVILRVMVRRAAPVLPTAVGLFSACPSLPRIGPGPIWSRSSTVY